MTFGHQVAQPQLLVRAHISIESCTGTRAVGQYNSPLWEGASQQRQWNSTGSWPYNPASRSAAPHPVTQQRGNLSSPNSASTAPFPCPVSPNSVQILQCGL